MFHQSFPLKIHAKCFQFTQKNMALPILKFLNTTLIMLIYDNKQCLYTLTLKVFH